MDVIHIKTTHKDNQEQMFKTRCDKEYRPVGPGIYLGPKVNLSSNVFLRIPKRGWDIHIYSFPIITWHELGNFPTQVPGCDAVINNSITAHSYNGSSLFHLSRMSGERLVLDANSTLIGVFRCRWEARTTYSINEPIHNIPLFSFSTFFMLLSPFVLIKTPLFSDFLPQCPLLS